MSDAHPYAVGAVGMLVPLAACLTMPSCAVGFLIGARCLTDTLEGV